MGWKVSALPRRVFRLASSCPAPGSDQRSPGDGGGEPLVVAIDPSWVATNRSGDGCDPASAVATNRLDCLMSDAVELAEVPELFERRLAARPWPTDRGGNTHAMCARTARGWPGRRTAMAGRATRCRSARARSCRAGLPSLPAGREAGGGVHGELGAGVVERRSNDSGRDSRHDRGRSFAGSISTWTRRIRISRRLASWPQRARRAAAGLFEQESTRFVDIGFRDVIDVRGAITETVDVAVELLGELATKLIGIDHPIPEEQQERVLGVISEPVPHIEQAAGP